MTHLLQSAGIPLLAADDSESQWAVDQIDRHRSGKCELVDTADWARNRSRKRIDIKASEDSTVRLSSNPVGDVGVKGG